MRPRLGTWCDVRVGEHYIQWHYMFVEWVNSLFIIIFSVDRNVFIIYLLRGVMAE